jgi:hypothetical protein
VPGFVYDCYHIWHTFLRIADKTSVVPSIFCQQRKGFSNLNMTQDYSLIERVCHDSFSDVVFFNSFRSDSWFRQ